MACAAVAHKTLAPTAPKDKVLEYAVALLDGLVMALLDEAAGRPPAAEVVDKELLDRIPDAPAGIDLAFTMRGKPWKREVEWRGDDKEDDLTKAARDAAKNIAAIEERVNAQIRAGVRVTACEILTTLRKNGIHPELVNK